MSVLGHIELNNMNRWRIAPPVLAAVPTNSQFSNAILSGARTAGLLSRLRAACHRHGAKVVTSPLVDMPALISVTSSNYSGLSAVADEAGAVFQANSPLALLACTPTIQKWPRTPCAMVNGRVDTARRFSRSKLDWVDSTLDEAKESKHGFFRIQRDWDWVSIIKMGSDKSAYIDDHAGRLIVAQRVKAASWDLKTETLSIPAQLFPPRLIARALAICSGKPPDYDQTNRRIRFSSVPVEVVKLALSVTGLRLS